LEKVLVVVGQDTSFPLTLPDAKLPNRRQYCYLCCFFNYI